MLGSLTSGFDQRLERPEPEYLVQDLLDQLFPFLQVERRSLAVQQVSDDLPNFGDRLFFVARAERAEVQPLEELTVHARAYLLKLGAAAGRIELRVRLERGTGRPLPGQLRVQVYLRD